MAEPRPVAPALLVVALFSRHAEALAWGRQRLEQLHGPIAILGEPFAFQHTAYYAAEMGVDLLKQLIAFRALISPDRLPEIKHEANALEQELAASGVYPEARPLNLDPGLLTLGKFMLATTKDQSHRVYLRDGIFAEVTLRFQAGTWEPWPWTYADYREPFVAEFLLRARTYYQSALRQR